MFLAGVVSSNPVNIYSDLTCVANPHVPGWCERFLVIHLIEVIWRAASSAQLYLTEVHGLAGMSWRSVVFH
ncbi:hypothetical protein RRG08_003917 [Elysia crispata]|uniref:Uncharacterized protein n=1 Tax=Elysia crispata TaxID=231223 RepID=A0AAE0YT41_9GAST|nr:hypothetical protein RRG08_003917 [Elysia crispata]